MASVTNVTTYSFNLTLVRGEDSDSWTATFTSSSGMTDQTALQFAQHFLNLPWPTGVTPLAAVTRRTADTIQSDANLESGVFI